MVDQKFLCVTVILLIIGSCVNSQPTPGSSEPAPPALIASSSNSSELRLLRPRVVLHNVISVPNNCPEGERMSIDGICREVFD